MLKFLRITLSENWLESSCAKQERVDHSANRSEGQGFYREGAEAEKGNIWLATA